MILILSSLMEQSKKKKCQIKHGLRFAALWDGLFASILLHDLAAFTKSQYELMAAAVQNASSGENQLQH